MSKIDDLLRYSQKEILNQQRLDGGWSFTQSGASAIELTCLALLALRSYSGAACSEGIRFLLSTQNPNGSWSAFVGDDPEGCWVTSLAVITLRKFSADWKPIERAGCWLLNVRGREAHWLWKWRYRTTDRKVSFDPDQFGWPWTPGTTSWVVPTAFGLIALRQCFGGRVPKWVDFRLRKGTAMLLDRACSGGGWNVGNSVVCGVPLSPHADTTAVALLALDGADRTHPTVQAGLRWLQENIGSCRSFYSLAWTMLALKAHNRSTELISERISVWLVGRQRYAVRRTFTPKPLSMPSTQRSRWRGGLGAPFHNVCG
jgi:hypothetical protein